MYVPFCSHLPKNLSRYPHYYIIYHCFLVHPVHSSIFNWYGSAQNGGYLKKSAHVGKMMINRRCPGGRPQPAFQSPPSRCSSSEISGDIDHLKNMSSSVGMMKFPIYEMENKKCAKPPTRLYIYIILYTCGGSHKRGIPNSWMVYFMESPFFLNGW